MTLGVTDHTKQPKAQLIIDELQLELPVSLGARKQVIAHLLRRELKHPALLHALPSGQLRHLAIPPLVIAAEQTNSAIARQLAQAIARAAHAVAVHRLTGGSQA
jgi:hypothetical protein